MEFDVVIVDAELIDGVARGRPAPPALRGRSSIPPTCVCVHEEGCEVGAHGRTGAVLEPRALDELPAGLALSRRASSTRGLSEDRLRGLTEYGGQGLPAYRSTSPIDDDVHLGNYIISARELLPVPHRTGGGASGRRCFPSSHASEVTCTATTVRSAGSSPVSMAGRSGDDVPHRDLHAGYRSSRDDTRTSPKGAAATSDGS